MWYGETGFLRTFLYTARGGRSVVTESATLDESVAKSRRPKRDGGFSLPYGREGEELLISSRTEERDGLL